MLRLFFWDTPTLLFLDVVCLAFNEINQFDARRGRVSKHNKLKLSTTIYIQA